MSALATPGSSRSISRRTVAAVSTLTILALAISFVAPSVDAAHPTTTYSVTFAASGIPAGTSWGAALAGSWQHTTSLTIVFSEAAGSYRFQISHPAGYAASPKSGVVAVVGSVTVSVSFAPFGQASSIVSNFNGNKIAAGDFIWFNSVLKPSSSIPSSGVTVKVVDQTISFDVGTSPVVLTLPDAKITYQPGATTGATHFNASQNRWLTDSPTSFTDNVFLSGLAFQVPSGGLPGGISSVNWSGYFASSIANFTIHWQWAAAVYTNFSTAYNLLDVKPLHSSSLDAYPNGDQAGTPEAFASSVVGGARGGGGSNFTGSYSSTASVALPQN